MSREAVPRELPSTLTPDVSCDELSGRVCICGVSSHGRMATCASWHPHLSTRRWTRGIATHSGVWAEGGLVETPLHPARMDSSMGNVILIRDRPPRLRLDLRFASTRVER